MAFSSLVKILGECLTNLKPSQILLQSNSALYVTHTPPVSMTNATHLLTRFSHGLDISLHFPPIRISDFLCFSICFWFFIFYFFNNRIVLVGLLPWKIQVAFPRESQLQQSHATQPMVHAGRFGVSIIHQILTWTTGSLTCAQMLMHAIAQRGVRTYVRPVSYTHLRAHET